MDNELYTNPRTAMLFGDAKAVLANLNSALTAYITVGPGCTAATTVSADAV